MLKWIIHLYQNEGTQLNFALNIKQANLAILKVITLFIMIPSLFVIDYLHQLQL